MTSRVVMTLDSLRSQPWWLTSLRRGRRTTTENQDARVGGSRNRGRLDFLATTFRSIGVAHRIAIRIVVLRRDPVVRESVDPLRRQLHFLLLMIAFRGENGVLRAQ